MKNRLEMAKQKHECGFNCAQSVLCTYADLLEMDEDVLFKIAEGFGAGMADMQGTCGAVTAAYMVAGLLTSTGKDQHNSKPKTMATVKEITQAFKELNQSVICKELKGIETGVMLRSCPGCIEDATRIVGEKFFGL